MARKKPKRPRAPKASSSYETWKNYEKRIKEWKAKCRKVESDKKAKAALINRLRRAA